jgi:two-component system, NarL family, response regulator LiaR
MSAPPIRVLIVDDHAMIRRGLRAYLLGRSDVEVVGEAGDGQEALDAVAALQPDVILMDVQMPRLNGIEAARQVRARAPDARIVMLTSYDNQEVAQTALRLGASAYLLKSVSEEDLVAAIRFAHAGHVLLPPDMEAQPEPPRPPAPTDGLSFREREILALVAAGLGNKEIAHRLSLSLSTVKFHVSNIIAKLGVSGRMEAALVARRQGLAPEP